MKYYKRLLELIKEYKKTKIWETVSGDDVFKIKGYKKPIYVALLGQEQSCNEINVYVGKEELYDQYDVLYGDYYRHPDAYFRISCYKLIVEDPEPFLDEEDKEILKKNHIKKDHAIIRLEKGKFPRLITEEEATFLVPIMEDIIKIVHYIKEEDLKFPEKIDLSKQYVFSTKEKVSHKIEKFETGHDIKVKETQVNEEILNKVLIFSQKGTMGVGFFYGPFYNPEEKNFNRLLIVSDLENGNILDVQAISQKDQDNLMNYLLESFLKIKRYPKNIAFSSTMTFLRCQKLIGELKMNYKVDIENDLLFEQWAEIRDYAQK